MDGSGDSSPRSLDPPPLGIEESSPGQVRLGPARLHYMRWGDGPQVVLAFHGFGLDHRQFADYALRHPEQTVYSFDLFFHGDSQWTDRHQALSSDVWCALLAEFLRTESIARFSLLGYSLGARLALATALCSPERVERITLLAPDGLRINPWYRLATFSAPSRNLLRSLVFRPRFFFSLVNTLGAMRLIDKSLLRFATTQMNTREKRWRVYSSWVVFRQMAWDTRLLAQELNRHKIPVQVVVGQFDKVITEAHVRPFVSLLSQGTLTRLPVGHNRLVEHFVANNG